MFDLVPFSRNHVGKKKSAWTYLTTFYGRAITACYLQPTIHNGSPPRDSNGQCVTLSRVQVVHERALSSKDIMSCAHTFLIWVLVMCFEKAKSEMSHCSSFPIKPRSGLCIDKIFQLKSCTGHRKWFQHTSADLKSRSLESMYTLENYTSRYCYPKIISVCDQFLPSSTVQTLFYFSCSYSKSLYYNVKGTKKFQINLNRIAGISNSSMPGS